MLNVFAPSFWVAAVWCLWLYFPIVLTGLYAKIDFSRPFSWIEIVFCLSLVAGNIGCLVVDGWFRIGLAFDSQGIYVFRINKPEDHILFCWEHMQSFSFWRAKFLPFKLSCLRIYFEDDTYMTLNLSLLSEESEKVFLDCVQSRMVVFEEEEEL